MNLRFIATGLIIAAGLLTVIAVSTNLTLALPFVQAEKLHRISLDTDLTFPSSSRVVEFSNSPHSIDPEWAAKIMIPQASYAAFKDAVLKIAEQHYGNRSPRLIEFATWYKPTDINLNREFFAKVDNVVLIASREGGEWAIYLDCTTL